MGKELYQFANASSPNITINSFSERYFHELDTVNFLASGKEWYGEEFSNMPGRSLTRNFPVNIPNIVNGSALIVTNTIVLPGRLAPAAVLMSGSITALFSRSISRRSVQVNMICLRNRQQLLLQLPLLKMILLSVIPIFPEVSMHRAGSTGLKYFPAGNFR